MRRIRSDKDRATYAPQAFSAAVQYGLDGAHELRTSSRGKLYQRCYPPMRASFGLPSDYARMAVNAAVWLARSYYGLRKSKSQKRTAFPKVTGSQGLGLDAALPDPAAMISGGRCVSRPNGETACSLSTVTPSCLSETVMGM